MSIDVRAECRLCAHEWVCGFSLGMDPQELECPRCGEMDGVVVPDEEETE